MKSNLSAFYLTALLIVVLAGCSAGSGTDGTTDLPEHLRDVENITVYPADTAPTHTIALVPVQTFGDRDEPLISNIMGVAIADHDRVLLSDRSGQNSTLHAFNPDGSYHSQIGRSGQGPGEYRYIGELLVKSGNIYLHDAQTNRLSLYSADDFSFIESVIPEQWGVIGHEAVSELRYTNITPRNDGNYILRFTAAMSTENEPVIQKQLIVDSSGSLVVDNVIEFPDAGGLALDQGGRRLVMYGVPFRARTLQVLSDTDDIYSVWTEDFLVKKYDASGNYQSAFYHQPQKALFDADSYFEDNLNIEGFDVRRGIEDAIGTTDVWPVLEQMIMDDNNRLWAAVIVEDQEIYEWWVLAESGELVATFDWPRDKRVMAIKNGHLYTREIDEETSLHTVEKYQIQLVEQ